MSDDSYYDEGLECPYDEGLECPYNGVAYNKISGYVSGYGCPICGGTGEAHSRIYPKGPLLSSDVRRMVEHVKLLRDGTVVLRIVDSYGIEFQGVEARRLKLSEPVAIYRAKPSDLDNYPEEWLEWAAGVKKVWEEHWDIPLIIIPPKSDVRVVEPVVEGSKEEQLHVQLAGCLTAAEGATSEDQVAKKGDYGWSPAYQVVLELRRDYDLAMQRVREAEDAMVRAGDRAKSIELCGNIPAETLAKILQEHQAVRMVWRGFYTRGGAIPKIARERGESSLAWLMEQLAIIFNTDPEGYSGCPWQHMEGEVSAPVFRQSPWLNVNGPQRMFLVKYLRGEASRRREDPTGLLAPDAFQAAADTLQQLCERGPDVISYGDAARRTSGEALPKKGEPVEEEREADKLWWVLMDVAGLSFEEVRALPGEARRKLARAVAKIVASGK